MIKRIILLIGLAFLIAACGGKKSNDQSSSMPMNQKQDETMKMDSGDMQMHDGNMDMPDQSMGKNEAHVYYTCPMETHKHVHSNKPGDCPECEMKLVEAVTTDAEHADFYGCPMESHSHIRSDKPGKCDECGMTLKPMRLKKS